jgi:molecular chaperone DnaJ
MRYPNIGDNLFETLPRGDLYVQITVHGSEDYGVNGIDLYHQIEVNSLLPIIGGEVEVRGIEGNTFLLTIPKGTQPRTKFRVAHQGLYQMNSNNRGHLYVEMLVKTPTNLTDEQLQLIKTIITQ